MKKYIVIFVFLLQTTIKAELIIHGFETQLKNAECIVIGKFKEDELGKIQFNVENSLKGNLSSISSIIVNKDSKLAWKILLGGGVLPPSDNAEFVQAIKKKNWYTKKVILVGKIVDGKWVSCSYDWSVWVSGKSIGEEGHKELSLEDLIDVIKSGVEGIEAPKIKPTS